jgi:hypothetical protein
MAIRFDIDKEKQIITGTVTGEIHREILVDMLAQLKILTANTPGCNLIFDFRDTELSPSQMDMYRVIDIVSTIIAIREQFGEKIAHLVPDRKDRIIHAQDIGSVAKIRGINYQVFTRPEQARRWLTL